MNPHTPSEPDPLAHGRTMYPHTPPDRILWRTMVLNRYGEAFWGRDPVDEKDVQDREIRSGVAQVWEKIASPNSVDGCGCRKDVFVRQGLDYMAKLEKSGWEGDVEVVEAAAKRSGGARRNVRREKSVRDGRSESE